MNLTKDILLLAHYPFMFDECCNGKSLVDGVLRLIINLAIADHCINYNEHFGLAGVYELCALKKISFKRSTHRSVSNKDCLSQ